MIRNRRSSDFLTPNQVAPPTETCGDLRLLPMTYAMVDLMAQVYHGHGPTGNRAKLLLWWRNLTAWIVREGYGALVDEKLATLNSDAQSAACTWVSCAWHSDREALCVILEVIGAPANVQACALELHDAAMRETESSGVLKVMRR